MNDTGKQTSEPSDRAHTQASKQASQVGEPTTQASKQASQVGTVRSTGRRTGAGARPVQDKEAKRRASKSKKAQASEPRAWLEESESESAKTTTNEDKPENGRKCNFHSPPLDPLKVGPRNRRKLPETRRTQQGIPW